MYMYAMEYYSAIKNNENTICSNVDATEDSHTRWIKSERERQIPYGIIVCGIIKKKGYKWTYSFVWIEEKQIHRLLKIYDYQREQVWGKGQTRGLGLAYAYWGIRNDWPTGICCITQGTLLDILWWSMWEKNPKENGCVYMYNWITLLYRRNYQNIVN